MQTEKDIEQDALIRQNAESIRQNREAILRQTAALEKIRDHYFPKKTLWKQASEFFLKAVGAVTVAAGLLEAADWYVNTRQTESMATESARVARRLFFDEGDAAGAMRFLEKAVELDGEKPKYRIALTYVKGLSALVDLFEVGRPLTDAERERVDAILAESVFLQEVAPDEPMPYVLAAQTQMLRGELETAVATIGRAVGLDPECVQARVSSCAIHFAAKDVETARKQLAEAERLNPEFPLVLFWKLRLALVVDRDVRAATACADVFLRRAPKLPQSHVQKAVVLLAETPARTVAARASIARALALSPKLVSAMVLMSETYARENKAVLARLWLDRALAQDPNCMAALLARARLGGPEAVTDLTKAVALAPFRADLYRLRAAAFKSAGDNARAEDDLKTAEALEGQ